MFLIMAQNRRRGWQNWKHDLARSCLILKLKNCDRHENSLANTLNICRAQCKRKNGFCEHAVCDKSGGCCWHCRIIHSPLYGRELHNSHLVSLVSIVDVKLLIHKCVRIRIRKYSALVFLALKTYFFAIFHTPSYTKGVWKIAKSHNHLAKFSVKNDCGK